MAQPSIGIDHVSLLVRDMDRSIAFYTGVLGLELLPPIPSYPTTIRWLSIGGIDALHLTQGDFGSTYLTKTTHFALRHYAFDQLIERLRSTGQAFCDWFGAADVVGTRPDGIRGIYLEDPDGYWVEINDHTQP